MRCFGRRGKFFGARLDWSPRFTFYGSGWRRFRDLRWMHGPVVVVDILTRPTLGAPRRALFPGRWRDAMSEGPFNSPSKLARSPFGAGLIGLLLRAWTSTDFLQIRLIWRARSASKGDQQPSPLSLWCARSASFQRRLLRRTPQTLITSTRFFLGPDQGFADVCNAYSVPEERRFSFDRRGK